MPRQPLSVIDKLSQRVSRSGFSAGTLRLDIPGHQPVMIAGLGVSEADGPADCTIVVDVDLLQQFLDGSMDPHWALMEGRITYTGDFAVARAFGGMLA